MRIAVSNGVDKNDQRECAGMYVRITISFSAVYFFVFATIVKNPRT
jgi:hypothetical protein